MVAISTSMRQVCLLFLFFSPLLIRTQIIFFLTQLLCLAISIPLSKTDRGSGDIYSLANYIRSCALKKTIFIVWYILVILYIVSRNLFLYSNERNIFDVFAWLLLMAGADLLWENSTANWLVAGGWCWFSMRKQYCWLVGWQAKRTQQLLFWDGKQSFMYSKNVERFRNWG